MIIFPTLMYTIAAIFSFAEIFSISPKLAKMIEVFNHNLFFSVIEKSLKLYFRETPIMLATFFGGGEAISIKYFSRTKTGCSTQKSFNKKIVVRKVLI